MSSSRYASNWSFSPKSLISQSESALGGARVVCNPLGYPLRSDEGHWFVENSGYNPHLVIETDAVTPAHKVLRAASAEREALAAQWPNAVQVSAALGSQHGAEESATKMRRSGLLLAVFIAIPTPSYRYPTWQFRPDGQPVGHLADILAVLRDCGPFEREPDGLRRTTGWGEVEWFLSPHALLDGHSPAAMLTQDPARVLLAAQVEFQNHWPDRSTGLGCE